MKRTIFCVALILCMAIMAGLCTASIGQDTDTDFRKDRTDLGAESR